MPLLPPLLLQYYITYRCNCRCRFCGIGQATETADADVVKVRQRLREARQLGVRFVDFTGGEPLLHSQLPDMLRAGQRLGLKTTLTTNTLLYPECAKEIKGAVDFLHFSIDAANAELHNRIRGAQAFDMVLQSLDLALSLGERPDLLLTVTEDNLTQLPLLSRIAEKLGLILIVNPVFSHKQDQLLSLSALAFIERFTYHPYVYVNTAFNRLRRQGGNQIDQPRCRVMDGVLVVSPDNQLLAPCFHFCQDQRPISSLIELRHSIWFQGMRNQQGRFASCQGCTLNCYFDPSFSYILDRFLFESIQAKMRYAWFKYKKPVKNIESARTVFTNTVNEK